jgi:hypothetical protein
MNVSTRKTKTGQIILKLILEGCDVMDWIDLAQGGYQLKNLMKTVMKIRVRQDVGKCSSSYVTRGLSSRAQLAGVC